jgi:L,D-transpeptidase catalytic domain
VKLIVAIQALALSCACATSATAQQVDVSSGSVAQAVAHLRPGQFVWVPDIAPAGPMLLIVNLKTQHAVLYRNGVPIGASTVSTGRPGHGTPTGVFTILQKQVEHYSSKYDSAPMPYMQRLTWYGVALHAGNLPGYPASHGCIRMPKGFAQLLYSVTGLGMTVVIADLPAAPHVAPTPTLLTSLSEDALQPGTSWNPDKSPTGPVSVVVSAADGRAIVLRNGVVIGSAPVTVTGPVTGTWAYSLRSIDASGQHWVRVELSPGPANRPQVPPQEWQRFTAPEAFKAAVAAIAEPGMTIVVTSDSLQSAAAPVPVLQSGS